MKYLIAGLGNIGAEYANTRHNIGFMVLDALAGASNIAFSDARYGAVAELRHKGRTFVLLKPSTYMNLSGKAVRYWMQEERIPIEKLLVVLDDIALPTGKLRLRASGSDGGHNGLKNIDQMLGSNQYARLRIGVGNEFAKGHQIDHVLGQFTSDEQQLIQPQIKRATDAVLCFGLQGVARTMNLYNQK
ncbi:MAG: aminoacyl-tRNA hydrolase [Bacteroidales bacterium]|nr:aminoacyl-tRNA hydrolase [Bacteroidales bacterium]